MLIKYFCLFIIDCIIYSKMMKGFHNLGGAKTNGIDQGKHNQ